jgi:hypothetical protein
VVPPAFSSAVAALIVRANGRSPAFLRGETRSEAECPHAVAFGPAVWISLADLLPSHYAVTL